MELAPENERSHWFNLAKATSPAEAWLMCKRGYRLFLILLCPQNLLMATRTQGNTPGFGAAGGALSLFWNAGRRNRLFLRFADN